MSIKIKNKNGFETEYIRPEKQPDARPAEEDTAIKRKDGTKAEYVHASQVGEEEMRQLLRQAEIRKTIARNEKIEKRIEERQRRDAEKEKKKKDAEQKRQKRLAAKQERAGRGARIHGDWLSSIKTVEYLGCEVVKGGTSLSLKRGRATLGALIGSTFGTFGAFLGAAAAMQEKQIPDKVFHKFFVLYKDGSSDTIVVGEGTRKFRDLMTLRMK